MKVTVSNLTNKPVNISRLAPLMPVMVLGVNQEITVNVKDIDAVIKKAAEIGVTVTPMDTDFQITEPKADKEPESIDGTTTSENNTDKETETEPVVETEPEETSNDEVTESVVETNDVAPETEKSEEVEPVTPVKSKRGRKPSKAKSAIKSILGNNK